MILYNINPPAKIKRLIASTTVTVPRRKKKVKKLTKPNKEFLIALGLKV